MRLNKFIASGTSLSRRAADGAIAAGRVTVNGKTAQQGQDVSGTDVVTLDRRTITPAVKTVTIMMHKPPGYVVSRDGQGSRTVYDLLPPEYQRLNPVGRLDKDSSGLLLLTSDGNLAHELTHPSKQKVKIYEVTLDKPLQPLHQQMISDYGVTLEDGPSKFQVVRMDGTRVPAGHASRSGRRRAMPDEHARSVSDVYQVTMREGRNRQIRRTFEALGYTVKTLHRTHFGDYSLGGLAQGGHQETIA